MIKQKKRLLKVYAIVISLMLMASLAGCGCKIQRNVAAADVQASTYTPPVNDEGYIIIKMPITLTGGYTAEELEKQHQEQLAGMSEEEKANLFWENVTANDDGSFNYYLTLEQYPKLKAAFYWIGCLRDPYTAEISQEFVTDADYVDFDENGIPWGVVVSVDSKTYYSMELWYSALATVNPAIFLGRYQVLCGIPGEEWAVHVTVKDADTGEVISEHDFPTRG